jgi:hypothetical protein
LPYLYLGLPRTWIARKNPLQLLLVQRSVLALLGRESRSEVRERVALDQARATLAAYAQEMSRGKMLLVPGDGQPILSRK